MTSVLLIDLNKRKNRTRILPKHGLFMYTSTWIYKLPIQLYLTYVKLIVSALSEVEITLKLDVCGFFLLDLNKARTTHNHSVTQEGFSLGEKRQRGRFLTGDFIFLMQSCMHSWVHACSSVLFLCVWVEMMWWRVLQISVCQMFQCKSWVFRADSALNKVSVALNI